MFNKNVPSPQIHGIINIPKMGSHFKKIRTKCMECFTKIALAFHLLSNDSHLLTWLFRLISGFTVKQESQLFFLNR